MRPYTVQILLAYHVPIDANWATVRLTRRINYIRFALLILLQAFFYKQVILGLLGLIATTFLLCIVRFVGKRRIYLFALFTTFSTSIWLGE